MQTKNILVALSVAAGVLAATPVETGPWNVVTPDFSTQQCEGGVVSGDDFSIPSTTDGNDSGAGCSNGHLRAERRYNNDYSTGVHQFYGAFTINSMSGDRVAIKQTFNGDVGPYFILGVESNGDLYSVEGGASIATGVATVGATVEINTVHNADVHRYSLYVNGKEMFRDEAAPDNSFYDKCGAYTTDSGTGALDITWDDVEFWTRG